MNCNDVEPFLDQLIRPPISPGVDEFALREHLAGCSNCQRTLRSLVQWEGQLNQAMNEVAVPSGLSKRLIATLAHAAPADSISKPAPDQLRPRSGWRKVFTSSAVVGLLCLVGWGAWQLSRPPKLSPTDVSAILQQSIDDLPMAEKSGRLLPRHWSTLKGKVYTGDAKKMDLREHRLSLVVFPLQVSGKRGSSVAGSLFVVPKSRWNSATGIAISKVSVSDSAVFYAPNHVWIAWAETDSVFILALDGEMQLLEWLRSRLGGHHAFL